MDYCEINGWLDGLFCVGEISRWLDRLFCVGEISGF